MRKTVIVFLTALGILLASDARADFVLTADLSIGNEPSLVGPSRSGCTPVTDPACARPTPFGEAMFVMSGSGATLQMTMDVTVFNLDFTHSQTPTDTNDDVTAAHIHVFDFGQTTPTASVRWGFFGSPFNDTQSPGLLPPIAGNPLAQIGCGTGGACITPFATGVGAHITSVWNATEGNAGQNLVSLQDEILAGLAYINFHTVQNPGGEIRGALLFAPEPGTLLLTLLTVGVLAMRRASPPAAR